MKVKSFFIVAALALAAGVMSSVAQVQTAQPTTIRYWHINTESFGRPTLRTLITEFERENPDIRVEETSQLNGYTGLLQATQATLAAGNPPDLIQVGNNYLNFVSSKLPYVPVATLATKFNSRAYLANFSRNVLQIGQDISGVQVGMPYSLGNLVVYYNADLLRQAGSDPARPPRTWAEWRTVSQVIRDKLGKFGIYILLFDLNLATEALIGSNGGVMLTCSSTGTYRAAFDSARAAQALQFWADLVKDRLALNALEDQGAAAFLSGQSATFIGSIADRAYFQKQATFDLRATRFPQFGSQPLRMPSGGNTLVMLTKDQTRQQAAWKFTQFLTSPTGFTAWTKGTGYLPLLPAITTDPRYLADFIRQNPIQEVALSQLPNAVRWTSYPGDNGLAASQAVFKWTQQALGGQISAAQALRSAAQEVNGLIQTEKCR